jgi:hypothetical protein
MSQGKRLFDVQSILFTNIKNFQAEEKREMITERLKEKPRVRPVQILTEARQSLNDEEYLELGVTTIQGSLITL